MFPRCCGVRLLIQSTNMYLLNTDSARDAPRQQQRGQTRFLSSWRFDSSGEVNDKEVSTHPKQSCQATIQAVKEEGVT